MKNSQGVIPFVVGALGTVPKGLENLEIRGRIDTTVICQNTQKSPGDLRRLAVTQTPVKDHKLALM